ncbi:MAG: PAS domain-containing protein, partial [Deltaproteobacteria bacterium]
MCLRKGLLPPARNIMGTWGQQVFGLLDGFPDVIFSTNPDGRFTYVSPQAEALFGCPAASLLGTPLWGRVVQEDRDAVASILALDSDSVFNRHVNMGDSRGRVKYVR